MALTLWRSLYLGLFHFLLHFLPFFKTFFLFFPLQFLGLSNGIREGFTIQPFTDYQWIMVSEGPGLPVVPFHLKILCTNTHEEHEKARYIIILQISTTLSQISISFGPIGTKRKGFKPYRYSEIRFRLYQHFIIELLSESHCEIPRIHIRYQCWIK